MKPTREGSMATIHEEIGGGAAVEAAVEEFYARVVADPLLAPYFDGVDMRSLKMHQRVFLAAALGGSDIYVGRSMRGAHLGMAVTPQAFDRVVEHLVATLEALAVPTEAIEAIGAKVLPLRADIVAPPDELGAALHAERARGAEARAALASAEQRLEAAAAAAAESGRRRWLSWRRPASVEAPAATG
jgi:hemoglobin